MQFCRSPHSNSYLFHRKIAESLGRSYLDYQDSAGPVGIATRCDCVASLWLLVLRWLPGYLQRSTSEAVAGLLEGRGSRMGDDPSDVSWGADAFERGHEQALPRWRRQQWRQQCCVRTLTAAVLSAGREQEGQTAHRPR